MKKRIISLTIALLLLCGIGLGVCAQTAETVVFDEAGLLSQSEQEKLTEKLLDIGQKYETQLVILTMDSQDVDIEQAADTLYNAMEFGYGENRNCVMLLIFMDTREVLVFHEGPLQKEDCDAIREAITPYMSDGEYAEAFAVFADQCEYYLDGRINGFPFNFGKTLLTCLIIGLVIGVIVALILKGQLKSVRQQNRADAYVKPGSMHITTANDFFLYRTLTRTKKASNNSSGGGSSRSSSRGSF